MSTLYYRNNRIVLGKAVTSPNKDDEFLNGIIDIASSWLKGKEYFSLTTSGTTGKTREITFTRHQLSLSARQTIKTFKLEKQDVVFLCLPVSHVAGFMMLIRALEEDMDVIAETPSGKPFHFDYPVKLAFASFVPQQMFNLLESGLQEKLAGMKTILVGGGHISDRLKEMIGSLKVPVFQTYGMTETLTHVAIRRLNGHSATGNYLPLKGVRFETDKNNRLIVYTPMLNQPVLTNDVVELFPDNSFCFIGRSDNIINSGGKKINPELLETKFEPIVQKNFGDVRFFLFGQPDEKLGERMELAIESCQEGNDKKVLMFLRSCKEKMGNHEVPKYIRFFNNFEYTALGKINKKKTLEKDER